jgi:hypothetical protein
MECQSMNEGSLGTASTSELLPPASSVREVEGRLPNRDRSRKDRPHQRVEEDSDENASPFEIDDSPEHRLDRLG